MELKKGDKENLTGNAVIYWKVEGDNLINPGHQIIASNFVISAIPLEEKLFTAIFPPIAFKTHNDFAKKLTNVRCDVIYGGKIQFPERNRGLNIFMRLETEKYNRIVEEYTNKYKLKFSCNPEDLSEKEQLYLLEELSKKIRKSITDGEYSDEDDSDNNSTKINKIAENLRNKYGKYEVDNLVKILYQPGKEIDNLTELYIKKFLAVCSEDYEMAQSLSDTIRKIESQIL